MCTVHPRPCPRASRWLTPQTRCLRWPVAAKNRKTRRKRNPLALASPHPFHALDSALLNETENFFQHCRTRHILSRHLLPGCLLLLRITHKDAFTNHAFTPYSLMRQAPNEATISKWVPHFTLTTPARLLIYSVYSAFSGTASADMESEEATPCSTVLHFPLPPVEPVVSEPQWFRWRGPVVRSCGGCGE